MSSKIISLYGMGLSLRDISSHIEEMYDVDISHNTLSEIIERIVPKVKEWQSRPLESMYTIVWLDAMHYKVKMVVVQKVVQSIMSWQSKKMDIKN